MSQPVSSSRSWRQSAKENQQTGKPIVALILLGLLIAGGVAAFIWYFRTGSKPAPVVKMIQATEYDLLEIAPYDFAEHDRALFANSQITLYAEDYEAEDLTNEGDLDTVAQSLQAHFGEGRADGIAILFLSAHGVNLATSDDNEAYILSNDFEFAQSGGVFSERDSEGISKLANLIEAFEAIPAKTKLLLVDTSRITSDLRMGMGVNEFPYHLERLVSESTDTGFWVICSTGLMQRSMVSYREGNSVFARAVNASFLKLGDKRLGANEEVSLFEFYDDIVRQCEAYAPRGTAYAQTPILMLGGHGFVDGTGGNADQLDLARRATVFYRTLDLEEEEADESDGESDEDTASFGPRSLPGQTSQLAVTTPVRSLLNRMPLRRGTQDDDSGNSQDDTSGGDDGTSDDGTATGDDGNSGDPSNQGGTNATGGNGNDSGTDPPTDEDPYAKLADLNGLQKAVLDVWTLRDQLENRRTATGWSPVDIAPDLWSNLVARIAQFGRIARTSQADSRRYREAEVEVAQIHSQLMCMIELASGQNSNNFQGENSDPGVRIIKAWQGYNTQSSGNRYESWSRQGPNERRTVDALRTYHDVMFRAKYFVRWHRDLSPVWDVSPEADFNRLMDELNRLQDRFETSTIGNADLGLGSDADALGQRADNLAGFEQNAYKFLIDLFVDAKKRADEGEDLIAGQMAASLLNSPLLPATTAHRRRSQETTATRMADDEVLTRVEVLALIEDIAKKPAPDAAGETDLPGASEFYGDTNRWGRASARMQFHKDLLQLVDSDSLQNLVIPQPGAIIDGANIESTLKRYRDASLELRKEYFRLIELANDRDRSDVDFFWVRRVAAISDPRDYGVFDEARTGVPPLNLIEKTRPEYIKFERDSYQHDMVEKTETVTLKLTARDLKRSRIQLDVDEFNSDLFDISINGEPVTGTTGEDNKTPFDIPYRAGRENYEITLEITAKYDQAHFPPGVSDRGAAIQLTAKGAEANSSATTKLLYGSYLPHFVDLMVVHRDTTETVPSSRDGFPAKDPINRMVIRPYTGKERFSPFEFYLLNRSRKEKKATVTFYAVTLPRSRPPLLPGRVSSSSADVHPEIKDHIDYLLSRGELQPFASSGQVTLKPASSPAPTPQQIVNRREPLKLGTPPSPDADADSPPPPPDPMATFDISHGILCRIDVEGDETVDKWVELTPQRPESYLNLADRELIVNYDKDDREVTVDIDRRRDGIWRDYPFKFFGDIEIELIPVHNENLIRDGIQLGTINADESASMVLGLKDQVLDFPRAELLQIVADVDSYPRAIAYDVMVGPRSVAGEPSRKRLRRVGISKIMVIRGDKDPVELRPTPDNVWALRPADELEVTYEIDAPLEQFVTIDDVRNYIEVSLRDDRNRGDSKRFYFDRHVTHTASLSKQGELMVQTTVTELTHRFRADGMSGTKLLAAELVLDGEIADRDRQSISLPLIFDTAPPVITHYAFENGSYAATIPQNKTIKIELGVRDEDSKVGPGGVQFYWSPKPEPPYLFDDAHLISDLPQNATGNTWTLTLRPETIKRTGEVWIIPRVEDRVQHVVDELERPQRPLALNITPPVEDTGGEGGSDNMSDRTYTLEATIKWGYNATVADLRLGTDPEVSFEVEGPRNVPAERKEPHIYQFADLPPGTYKIKATMTSKNNVYSTEKEVVIKEGGRSSKVTTELVLVRE